MSFNAFAILSSTLVNPHGFPYTTLARLNATCPVSIYRKNFS